MSDEASPDVGALLRVTAGNPTPEELAAIVAVVSESYQREAAEAVAAPAPKRSAWQVSARGLRTPLDRDRGWGAQS